ncbi:sulfur oxidation c-type cytochrome SoxX [Bradyrhizobium neotropicale]|uniref:Sulfur oxidation c-type cytochrome SoxX n=2 Tax=Bradyrhizobium neotropicale TaxID=1497615 RepID=A0A176ZGE7_9BRAD|nr:sulfur oxidation c-type cytochrome SoxX [Bradyrhizobium neotropicale]OAF19294.1 sulfur oxidation c-type cytochrome SoxX [Bradyrhizobium neotropicale]
MTMISFGKTLLVGAALSISFAASAAAQTATKSIDLTVVDRYVASTFGKAAPEWLARIKPDATLETCNASRNDVPSAEADKITARELARVVYPADGKLLGNWKEGAKVANDGRGNQFSDPPGLVAGGNCYACHQIERSELSYGTLGPSLTNYGKDRKYDPEEVKRAYAKIYDSQAFAACSIMPRFGANKVLTETQIKNILAFLFDPESPLNK